MLKEEEEDEEAEGQSRDYSLFDADSDVLDGESFLGVGPAVRALNFRADRG